MAFRTNKVPAIEERTVSGSSVSFNSAFALPLKACKVSFSATESGSGTKSPSNPYTISGVSSLNLSANSVPVSVNFGDTYYGAVFNLVSGLLTVISVIVDMGNLSWNKSTVSDYVVFFATPEPFKDNTTNMLCSIYSVVNKIRTQLLDGEMGLYNSNNETNWRRITIRDDSRSAMTGEEFATEVSGQKIVYALETPIEIQLSANELSSIIGNNTFSTDTGTLEITFADLQEKSASGSVASFNTALAMPLVKCEVSFSASQSGSGTPTPTNPRSIVGVSSLDVVVNGSTISEALGDTYYDGVLDLLSGLLTINSVKVVLRGSMFSAWVSSIRCIRAASSVFDNPWLAQEGGSGLLFSHGRVVSRDEVSSYNNCVIIGDTTGGNQGVMLLKINSEITDLTSGQAYIESQYELGTPLEVTYLLATPQTIQLTPEQITTIIGVNTISSTGDIDLTYKDLDIAKRGNFREVFKLPS